MESKQKIIIIGSVIIALIIGLLILFLVPTIKININGEKYVTINYNDEYNDEGATAFLQNIFSKKEYYRLHT